MISPRKYGTLYSTARTHIRCRLGGCARSSVCSSTLDTYLSSKQAGWSRPATTAPFVCGNVRTGECVHVLQGHVGVVRCVAFDGHRRILARTVFKMRLFLWILFLILGHADMSRG